MARKRTSNYVICSRCHRECVAWRWQSVGGQPVCFNCAYPDDVDDPAKAEHYDDWYRREVVGMGPDEQF